jgi:hypothetical protein
MFLGVKRELKVRILNSLIDLIGPVPSHFDCFPPLYQPTNIQIII